MLSQDHEASQEAKHHCALITTQVMGDVNCQEAMLSGCVPWVEASELSCSPA